MKETYFSCISPAGTGAVATLAVRGPQAWEQVRGLSQRELPALPESGQFWLARFGEAAAADQVLIAVKQTTPEIWVELHCHGGRELVQWLQELLAARGLQPCSWPELERQTNPDPFQTAALPVLANAMTARTAAIALDQYQGAFSNAVQKIRDALQNEHLPKAIQLLADLQKNASLGLHLATPWRVVIAGAPNVGKSSLVNALAGYQRSIVSCVPGTTRDIVTTLIALDGWPVEIADTAGLRIGDSDIEREGIAHAVQAIQTADLCLWVLDAGADPVMPDANLGHIRFVINKSDLGSTSPLDQVDAVRVSAMTGSGLLELCQAVATCLLPEAPPPATAIPFTPRLVQGIAHVTECVNASRFDEAMDKLGKLCQECD